LKERYGDNLLTHLDFNSDLWLEAKSSGGLDRNRVYILSNTTAENLWIAHSISTVGCSQSVLSTQSLELASLLNQGVLERTTHLNEKYEQLSTDYEEFCWMVMDMRSHMGGTCASFYCLHGPGMTSLLLLL
jgi:hypothetical protein